MEYRKRIGPEIKVLFFNLVSFGLGADQLTKESKLLFVCLKKGHINIYISELLWGLSVKHIDNAFNNVDKN